MSRLLTIALVLTFTTARDSKAAEVILEHNVNPAEIYYGNATTALLKTVKIHEIPKNYFRDLGANLSHLRITNSRLTRIDEGAFDGLDHLNLLELTDDEITKIEPKTFSRLNGLELLQLKSNKLREVSLELNHVQEIVLAQNEITHLQKDFITGDSVTVIDLKSNKIQRLENSMKSLSKLATIYLSKNSITDIEPEVFADNDNLADVYASGNLLTSTRGLRLKQLKTLDLSSNRLTRLNNESFPEMSFLVELLLNGNQITAIDDAFTDTKNLQFIDLSDNQLTAIGPDTFKYNPYLSKLKLSKNKISNLNRLTGKLVHLRVLDLSRNKLESIDPDFFKSADKLEILDLSFNKLTVMGDLLSPLAGLITLDLSSNRVVPNRNMTRSNFKLKNLNMSSNGLDMSLSYLATNKDLKSLDLSNNNIVNFCDADLTLEYLSTINLSNNKIKELNCFKKIDLFPFAVVDIRRNPFTCDSNFDKLVRSFVLMQSTPYYTKDTRSDELETTLGLWNSVKREICPDGLDIHMTKSTVYPEIDDEDGDKKASQGERYWEYDYYDTSLSPEFKIMDRRESTEIPDKDFRLEIEVDVAQLDMMQDTADQSERESWNSINKVQNIAQEYDEESPDCFQATDSQLSLFSISLICIGVSLILILLNVIVFMIIRMRGWKKDFRGVQKYTHLENKLNKLRYGFLDSFFMEELIHEVYKDTTVPSDFNAGGGKKFEGNYRINCARMFTNLNFWSGEEDTESVKKMIADNGLKASA